MDVGSSGSSWRGKVRDALGVLTEQTKEGVFRLAAQGHRLLVIAESFTNLIAAACGPDSTSLPTSPSVAQEQQHLSAISGATVALLLGNLTDGIRGTSKLRTGKEFESFQAAFKDEVNRLLALESGPRIKALLDTLAAVGNSCASEDQGFVSPEALRVSGLVKTYFATINMWTTARPVDKKGNPRVINPPEIDYHYRTRGM